MNHWDNSTLLFLIWGGMELLHVTDYQPIMDRKKQLRMSWRWWCMQSVLIQFSMPNWSWQDALSLPRCHFVAMDLGSIVALQITVTRPNSVLSLLIMSHTCLEEVCSFSFIIIKILTWMVFDSFLMLSKVEQSSMSYGLQDFQELIWIALSDTPSTFSATKWQIWHKRMDSCFLRTEPWLFESPVYSLQC